MQRPLTTEAVETNTRESAIALVLQAERAANAAIEADIEGAHECIDHARVLARAIASRAAQRTTRVHKLMDTTIARQLAQIAEERAQIQTAAAQKANTPNEDQLRAIVAQVAERLAQGCP